MTAFSESTLEEEVLETLESPGSQVVIGPDMTLGVYGLRWRGSIHPC
jgi:hypothetical protein